MRSAADGGDGAVTGNDSGFVGQSEQAGVDGVDDLLGIAAGQVGAADAAGEERVAGDDHFERREMKADGTLGVAGRVEDLGGVVVEADTMAVGQGFVGRGGFGSGNAEPGGLFSII